MLVYIIVELLNIEDWTIELLSLCFGSENHVMDILFSLDKRLDNFDFIHIVSYTMYPCMCNHDKNRFW